MEIFAEARSGNGGKCWQKLGTLLDDVKRIVLRIHGKVGQDIVRGPARREVPNRIDDQDGGHESREQHTRSNPALRRTGRPAANLGNEGADELKDIEQKGEYGERLWLLSRVCTVLRQSSRSNVDSRETARMKSKQSREDIDIIKDSTVKSFHHYHSQMSHNGQVPFWVS